MRKTLPLIKLLGVALFIGIIFRLDGVAIGGFVTQARMGLLASGLIALFGIFMIKALRWHLLVASAGAVRHWKSSWREYMIGVFLSTFTPAKLGDFGKIAYLKPDGIGTKTGALLVVMERVADFVVLLPLAAVSAGIIAHKRGLEIDALVTIILLLGIAIAARYWSKLASAIRYALQHHALSKVLLTTILGWVLHYAWAVFIARALGITIPVTVLVAAMTAATMLNALPIAPSGSARAMRRFCSCSRHTALNPNEVLRCRF